MTFPAHLGWAKAQGAVWGSHRLGRVEMLEQPVEPEALRILWPQDMHHSGIPLLSIGHTDDSP